MIVESTAAKLVLAAGSLATAWTPFRWTNLKAPPEIEVIISPTWE